MGGIGSILPRQKLTEIDSRPNKISHLAINLADIYFLEKIYNEKKDNADETITNELFKRNELIKSIIQEQIKTNTKVITLFLSAKKNTPIFLNKINTILSDLFSSINKDQIIEDNEIKVSIFGKWYDTPSNMINEIKEMLEKGKDNDKLFLNLCINYDGQEEILDACKVIALKSKLGKIDPNGITSKEIKDNLYISDYPTPDRIININKRRKLLSFMLWESANTRIHFIEKHWNEINIRELEKYFNKNK